MRSLHLAPLFVLATLSSCGSEPAPPGNDFDLARMPADGSLARDFAVPPDQTAPAPDLAGLPDLRPAPDLVVAPGGDCGGFIGKPCPGGQFCEYPMSCGGADELGTCRVPPQVCDLISDPVCGCDGKQYDNDCFRQAGKTSLFNHGVCGCRAMCGPKAHCAQCQNGPACVPNGAAC